MSTLDGNLRHGVVKNGLPLAEERETLAEQLRARGFQTAAVVSSPSSWTRSSASPRAIVPLRR